jgi:hypothetical protein
MKSLIPIAAVSVMSALLAGNSFAADVKEQRQEVREEREDVREQQRELREEANEEMQEASRASKIIGTDVKNAKGEDLGDIKDLVLDPMSGRLAYVVVSYGGFWEWATSYSRYRGQPCAGRPIRIISC